MKIKILFILLLFATATTFAQTKEADEPITGLGDIYFGMNKKEVAEAVKPYSTPWTEVSSGHEIVVATHLMLAQTEFDRCIFHFEDQELKNIVYEMYTDEANMDSKFSYLLSILEEDYGKQASYMESGKEKTQYRWYDGNVGLDLRKGYDKIRKMYIVTIDADWFRWSVKLDKYRKKKKK